jgi:hypothetical protein
MSTSDALPNVVAVFALLSYVVVLAMIVWGFYLAYLLTRALRKYLRT